MWGLRGPPSEYKNYNRQEHEMKFNFPETCTTDAEKKEFLEAIVAKDATEPDSVSSDERIAAGKTLAYYLDNGRFPRD